MNMSLLFLLTTLLMIVPSTTSWVIVSPSLIQQQQQRRTTLLHVQQHEQQDQDLYFQEEPFENLVGDVIEGPPEEDDVADLVRIICKAAYDRKGENIVALRVSKISTLTTFLVLVSGNSRPQNQAICASIEQDVQEAYNGIKTLGNGVPEGTPDSGWMLLDYGSVMVHVMTPKSRLFYNVEGQWRDKGGEPMDLSDIIIHPNDEEDVVQQEKEEGGSTTMEGLSEQDDPFWS